MDSNNTPGQDLTLNTSVTTTATATVTATSNGQPNHVPSSTQAQIPPALPVNISIDQNNALPNNINANTEHNSNNQPQVVSPSRPVQNIEPPTGTKTIDIIDLDNDGSMVQEQEEVQEQVATNNHHQPQETVAVQPVVHVQPVLPVQQNDSEMKDVNDVNDVNGVNDANDVNPHYQSQEKPIEKQKQFINLQQGQISASDLGNNNNVTENNNSFVVENTQNRQLLPENQPVNQAVNQSVNQVFNQVNQVNININVEVHQYQTPIFTAAQNLTIAQPVNLMEDEAQCIMEENNQNNENNEKNQAKCNSPIMNIIQNQPEISNQNLQILPCLNAQENVTHQHQQVVVFKPIENNNNQTIVVTNTNNNTQQVRVHIQNEVLNQQISHTHTQQETHPQPETHPHPQQQQQIIQQIQIQQEIISSLPTQHQPITTTNDNNLTNTNQNQEVVEIVQNKGQINSTVNVNADPIVQQHQMLQEQEVIQIVQNNAAQQQSKQNPQKVPQQILDQNPQKILQNEDANKVQQLPVVVEEPNDFLCFSAQSPQLTDIHQIRKLLLKNLPPHLSQLTQTLADEQLREMYLEIRADQLRGAAAAQAEAPKSQKNESKKSSKKESPKKQLNSKKQHQPPITTTSVSNTNTNTKISQTMIMQQSKSSDFNHHTQTHTHTVHNINAQTQKSKKPRKQRKRVVTTVVQQVQYFDDSDGETPSKTTMLENGELKKKKPHNKSQMQNILGQLCNLVKSLDLTALGNNGTNGAAESN